ncbi:MAG: TIGR04076 family protein, partial [Nitrospinae bacterium]|nr:TIGR04076 family protein [Nitrospinota bacterium]
GVGYKDIEGERNLFLRVLNLSGECPRSHAIGDVIEIPLSSFPLSPVDFSSCFPYLFQETTPFSIKTFEDEEIALISREKESKEYIRPCLQEDDTSKIHISVDSITFPCRYHQKEASFTEKDMTLDSLCLNALYSCYPTALALLYGKNEATKVVRCPDQKGEVVLKIEVVFKKPVLVYKAITKVNYLMNFLSHPIDIIDKEITITVMERRGDCPKGHNVGDVFTLNLYNSEKLCPASFFTIFPFYYDIKNESGKGCKVPCPDCVGTRYNIV